MPGIYFPDEPVFFRFALAFLPEFCFFYAVLCGRWDAPRARDREVVKRAMFLESYSQGKAHRYSAKRSIRPTNFLCQAPEAQQVSLIGDFNDWNPAANPMRRMPDGGWHLLMPLKHGHHQYLFCVDGKLVLDPRGQGLTRHKRFDKVSLIAIS